jgi:hypothetical protein
VFPCEIAATNKNIFQGICHAFTHHPFIHPVGLDGAALCRADWSRPISGNRIMLTVKVATNKSLIGQDVTFFDQNVAEIKHWSGFPGNNGIDVGCAEVRSASIANDALRTSAHPTQRAGFNFFGSGSSGLELSV